MLFRVDMEVRGGIQWWTIRCGLCGDEQSRVSNDFGNFVAEHSWRHLAGAVQSFA